MRLAVDGEREGASIVGEPVVGEAVVGELSGRQRGGSETRQATRVT